MHRNPENLARSALQNEKLCLSRLQALTSITYELVSTYHHIIIVNMYKYKYQNVYASYHFGLFSFLALLRLDYSTVSGTITAFHRFHVEMAGECRNARSTRNDTRCGQPSASSLAALLLLLCFPTTKNPLRSIHRRLIVESPRKKRFQCNL